MKILIFFLIPTILFSQTISEKKDSLTHQAKLAEPDIQELNNQLKQLRSQLQEAYSTAATLQNNQAQDADFKSLLIDVNQIKKEIYKLEESWRSSMSGLMKEEGEMYSFWDISDATLSQLVMEYGSLDYLYIVPPEISNIKLNLISGVPIPRESWESVLEIIFSNNGIGIKQIGAYTRQLYVLKNDLNSVKGIVSKQSDLAWFQNHDRIFYLLAPRVEQVKNVFLFFEKFADPRHTFTYKVGSKIAIVSTKEEIEKLLSLYNTVWEGQEGKISRVVGVNKMDVDEMEKVLTAFFGDVAERSKLPTFKGDQESLGIFPLKQSNSLVLIGSKEMVERAEKLVQETQEQLKDPTEMTVFLYKCRHSDPKDLAKVLEKVYVSLLTSSQDTILREAELSAGFQNSPGKSLEGYPAQAPLVVSPPSSKPGISSSLGDDFNYSDHFIPDPKTGTLLMTVRRDVLEKIQELLKKLDVPKKMVQIEVLLFERKINSQTNFGLNLLKLGKAQNGLEYSPIVGPAVGSKGILQFFFHGNGHKHFPQFDIAYNFLMTKEDIQLNASPSVITVNQTPATISIVEEISINNGAAPIDTNQRTSFEKSFARAQYGITIVLTPTIHPPQSEEEHGFVTLQTNITFDTTKPNPEERPLVDRRHIENEVRVVDGETVILGGLRRRSKQDYEEKIPLFGEIPGFGKLFGTTQLADQDTEMFFFITPKIMHDPEETVQQMRIEELKKRPGDIAEVLQRIHESREKERAKFFEQSMRVFLKNER